MLIIQHALTCTFLALRAKSMNRLPGSFHHRSGCFLMSQVPSEGDVTPLENQRPPSLLLSARVVGSELWARVLRAHRPVLLGPLSHAETLLAYSKALLEIQQCQEDCPCFQNRVVLLGKEKPNCFPCWLSWPQYS